MFGVLGLSVHLLLSFRAGLGPIINEANPSCPSVGSALVSILGFGAKLPGYCVNLTASLAREQYGKPSIFERQSPFWAQMGNYFQYFDWQWARSVSGSTGYFGSRDLHHPVSPRWAATPCEHFSATAISSCTWLVLGTLSGAHHRHELTSGSRRCRLWARAVAEVRDAILLLCRSACGLGRDRVVRLWLELSQSLAATPRRRGSPWWRAVALAARAPAGVGRSANWSYRNAGLLCARAPGVHCCVGGSRTGAFHQRRQRHLLALGLQR